MLSPLPVISQGVPKRLRRRDSRPTLVLFSTEPALPPLALYSPFLYWNPSGIKTSLRLFLPIKTEGKLICDQLWMGDKRSASALSRRNQVNFKVYPAKALLYLSFRNHCHQHETMPYPAQRQMSSRFIALAGDSVRCEKNKHMTRHSLWNKTERQTNGAHKIKTSGSEVARPLTNF